MSAPSTAWRASTTRWARPRFAPPGAGSVIAVVATDAPLLPGQCKALARRAPMGLARTGTTGATGSHFSGDIFLAFSTADAGALTSGFVPRRTTRTCGSCRGGGRTRSTPRSWRRWRRPC
ncbi:P1 family peptidase [Nonomuraea sp. NPDC003804]|uniref:P1 family peptidase n=1 Tax=Nonomuraea sp. NPDC003804 TaxID=3154547 RepID=UPI0033B5FF67